MFKNYFKIGWRNLLRHKTYAAINIIGLSLGIACAILIFTLVTFHLSFDSFHPDLGRIYRITTEFHDEKIDYSAAEPQPLGDHFKKDYTFAEVTARIVYFPNSLITLTGEKEVKKFQEEKGVAYTDPSFFDLFNYPLLKGNKSTALLNPNTAIITETLAKKYYGTADPIGKTFRVDNKVDYTITGVLKDLPPNTDRKQDIYVSYVTMKQRYAWFASDSSWQNVYSGCKCYVRLKPSITAAQVNKTFPQMSNK